MPEFSIREVKEEDLDRCYEIETISYGGEEAASKEKILKRIKNYAQGFLVIQNKKEIIGFINSGATNNVVLSDEEFKELIGHDDEGKCIVVMSVVIHPDYQGKGFTTPLMKAFISQMKELKKESIYLICQTELITLYKKYDFKYICESESDHGGLSWHEMVLEL